MIKIQCENCDRIVDYEADRFSYGVTCEDCGGDFEEVEDELEDEDDDTDTEDSDEEDETENVSLEDMIRVDASRHRGIIDYPNTNEEVQIEKFNPEAKTRFD